MDRRAPEGEVDIEVNLKNLLFLRDGMRSLACPDSLPKDDPQQLSHTPMKQLNLVLTMRLRGEEGKQILVIYTLQVEPEVAGEMVRCLRTLLFQRTQV